MSKIQGFPCHRPQDVTFGPDELVMIQDARTTVGNNVLWWREDAKGYTSRFDMAWKIPCKQALARCKMEYSVLFRVADIEPLLHRFVDVQEIPHCAGIPKTKNNRGMKKVPIPREANEG